MLARVHRCGSCIMSVDIITQHPQHRPLGNQTLWFDERPKSSRTIFVYEAVEAVRILLVGWLHTGLFGLVKQVYSFAIQTRKGKSPILQDKRDWLIRWSRKQPVYLWTRHEPSFVEQEKAAKREGLWKAWLGYLRNEIAGERHKPRKKEYWRSSGSLGRAERGNESKNSKYPAKTSWNFEETGEGFWLSTPKVLKGGCWSLKWCSKKVLKELRTHETVSRRPRQTGRIWER